MKSFTAESHDRMWDILYTLDKLIDGLPTNDPFSGGTVSSHVAGYCSWIGDYFPKYWDKQGNAR